MINEIFVMTLLIKDEKTDINEMGVMTIKFSSNLYQHQGAKCANHYRPKGSIIRHFSPPCIYMQLSSHFPLKICSPNLIVQPI